MPMQNSSPHSRLHCASCLVGFGRTSPFIRRGKHKKMVRRPGFYLPLSTRASRVSLIPETKGSPFTFQLQEISPLNLLSVIGLYLAAGLHRYD